MKTVLITGAAGFLGSHLASHHIIAGDLGWGLDNFCSSDPMSDHLDTLLAKVAYTHHNHDICHPIFPCEDIKFDLIYNFACPASPPVYQSMPINTMLTCVLGTKNVLALASRHRSVVVHASTSEVYGDPDRSPQSEVYKGSVNSYGPRACYDEGKRAAEALCYDYRNTYNVDVRLVRIFNTYGPHMDPYDGRVVSNFIRQALMGEPLTIYGNGKQSRSFCYVDDLVRAIVKIGAMQSNPGTPINIGNPNEFTINELAHLIEYKLALVNGITRVEKCLPIDDPTQRCPDITNAKLLLDWEPKIHLSEGLDKTIEYFHHVLKR